MQANLKASKVYYGWVVVGIAFLVLLVAAGINSVPAS